MVNFRFNQILSLIDYLSVHLLKKKRKGKESREKKKKYTKCQKDAIEEMVVEKALNYGFTGHFSVSVLKEIHRIMIC